MEEPILNPLVFYPRFPHIPELIFEQLDDESLTDCREVSKSWQKCIDNKKFSWVHIVNIPTTLKYGNTYLHVAAKTGQLVMFEKILEFKEIKNSKNKMPWLLLS